MRLEIKYDGEIRKVGHKGQPAFLLVGSGLPPIIDREGVKVTQMRKASKKKAAAAPRADTPDDGQGSLVETSE